MIGGRRRALCRFGPDIMAEKQGEAKEKEKEKKKEKKSTRFC